MLFRRDREPARRSEIERGRVAPDLADDRPKRPASQSFLHGPKRLLGIARFDVDEVAGDETVVAQEWTAGLQDRHAVLDPEQRSVRGNSGQREPDTAHVASVAGEHLAERRDGG